MSTISASDVKKLRDMTGAGMMDCKKALAEAEGDFDKAIEVLRKKGQKLSAKRADRDAREGVVLAVTTADKGRGVIVKLSCETDFVAKNEDFVALTQRFAELALDAFPATREEVLALPFDGITIGEKVSEQVGVIGEKIELADYQRLEAPMVAPYIHMGNKAGVLVGLSQSNENFYEAGREVAMQVAAMRPIAVDDDGNALLFSVSPDDDDEVPRGLFVLTGDGQLTRVDELEPSPGRVMLPGVEGERTLGRFSVAGPT